MSSQYLREDWSGIAARLRLEGCQQALRCALTSSQHQRGRGLGMLSRKTALKLLHSLICMVGWSDALVSLVGSRQRALEQAGLGWQAVC